MQTLILNCIFIVGFLKLVSANLTSCEISQKHFADLCFTPKPETEVDFDWLLENQPSEGWYVNIGNDLVQFHMSEIVKKEVLQRSDDFSDLCLKIGIDHSTGDGKISGYDGLSSNWTCTHSKDFPGTERCDLQIDHSKYHEDIQVYISYQDKKTKLFTAIHCYPTGQVGWLTLSKHPVLTVEERDAAIAHAEALGFPKDTHEVLYSDKCPK